MNPTPLTIEAILSAYMPTFFVAFVISVLATPLMILLARRLNVMDRPDYRKGHVNATPYLGGVALFLAWIAGSFIATLWPPHTSIEVAPPGFLLSPPLGIFLGAAILVTMGVLDDMAPIRARYKLLAQIAAAACLIVNGVGMELATGAAKALTTITGIEALGQTPVTILYLIAGFTVLFFVVGACNAANMLDGLDGLATGVTGVVTLGFLLIALALATGAYTGDGAAYSLTQDPLRIVFCMALLGALLGFLPYNFKPASIFMGDAGSMLLGYLAITIILLFGEKGDPLPVMAGLTVFTLPILDTALAIVRRKVRRMPLAAPDNYHLHHMFIRAGLGVRRSVVFLYLIALGFTALGCSMIFFRLRFVAAIFMVVFSFVAIMAYKIGHQQYKEDQQRKALEAAAPPANPMPLFAELLAQAEHAETARPELVERELVEREPVEREPVEGPHSPQPKAPTPAHAIAHAR